METKGKTERIILGTAADQQQIEDMERNARLAAE